MTDQIVVDEPAAPSAAKGRPAEPARRRPALRRLLTHEWSIAAFSSVLLSIAMTWPAARDLRHTMALDMGDPSLQSWELSWIGWAVKHDPGRLWQTNAFHGEHLPLAFSDSLLGYLPFALFGSGPQDAILRYNILYILVFALSFFGAYALARQLGSRVPGAVVAGAAFAYAPWHWPQGAHLNILSTGGIALALAMLARGHGYSLRDGYRPERVRPWWALAGWLTAAWQITLGFGIGIPFGYALAGLGALALIGWLVRRPPFSKRLLRMDAIGGLILGAVTAGMAYHYFEMLKAYPYGRRQLAEVQNYSTELRGFFATGPDSWLLGNRFPGIRENLIGGWEGLLNPGYALYALALIGLFVSVWSWRRRLLMFATLIIVGILAQGLQAPTTLLYRAMYKFAPGWDGMRTPGRLIVWITLLLAVLAAGAVTAIGERFGPRLRRAPRLVAAPLLVLGMLLPGALVVLEGVQKMPFKTAPMGPPEVANAAGPVLVLPMNWRDDQLTMLWSTDSFVTLANGSSGFFPAGINQTREVTRSFPDAASVKFLRDRGVKSVVVLRHPVFVNQPLANDDMKVPPNALAGPIDGLGITRQEYPETVVYRLTD
ncbi:hypothetical protein [Krasilnikovia sp. MM14-A1259]|uniref:hypothetical protein n=1 Tax=Krasilnikovia sp. MM14-A1259 TaxID=3373539 RepID=UPI0038200C29